jgi:phospholipid N-methyltransferase
MPSFALFLARFLQRPFQVASIMPSSPMMIRRVGEKMDLSGPCVVAEYGPGEGCHTREMLRRAHPESKFLLFELDPEFCRDLERQFANDPRVTVINGDAATLPEELAKQNLSHCDYVLSGIPFSILEIGKKRRLLQKTYDALRPGGDFVIYQVTNELRRHATPAIFPRADSEYFLQNVPPMFITVFHKEGQPAALDHNLSDTGTRTGVNGNGAGSVNGNGRHAHGAKPMPLAADSRGR